MTGRNPYARSIESTISYDTSLVERHQGVFQILLGESPDHPDSVLLDATREAKQESLVDPFPASLIPRSDILENYKKLYDANAEDDRIRIHQMVIAPVPDFVRSPLESLSPITLSEMMLFKAHTGRYIMCRVIHHSVRMVAIQAAIEDQNGDVADLALYHSFETKGMKRDAIASLLPVGLIIMVREPWFRPGATGGHPTIRVDSPTDIRFPSPTDPILSNVPDAWKPPKPKKALKYKDAGNKAQKKDQLEVAIRAYTDGLSVDPSASVLRLNRSWCHLQLGNVSLAISDGRAASEDETIDVQLRNKARYHMALCYYATDRFSDALAIADDGISFQFSPRDFQELRNRIKSRMKEQQDGKYNWLHLDKLAARKSGEILDVADFVGPIAVVLMLNKSARRGLVTTRNVMAGEILIVTKPFVLVSPADYPKDRLRCSHTERPAITEKAYYELIGRVARRLTGDHSAIAKLFLDLCPNEASNSEGTTDEILHPTFETSGGRHWNLHDNYETGDVDINKVRAIVEAHSFAEPVEGINYGGSEAIYLLPSLINHSCDGTAHRFSVGSISVVRASQNLQEGQEVTCSFIGGQNCASFLTREPALAKWLETCDCSLCEADRIDGAERCAQREKYYEELQQIQLLLYPGNVLQLHAYLKGLVDRIRGTYTSTRTAPMHPLGLAQRLLGYTFQAIDPTQTYNSYAAALQSHGIRWKQNPPPAPVNRSQLNRDSLIIYTDKFPSQRDYIFRAIKVMGTLAAMKMQTREDNLARHWAIAALWVHETFYGQDKQYLWESLGLNPNSSHVFVELLRGF